MSYADRLRDQQWSEREERRDAYKIAKACTALLDIVKMLRSQGMNATAMDVDRLAQDLLASIPADIAERVRAI